MTYLRQVITDKIVRAESCTPTLASNGTTYMTHIGAPAMFHIQHNYQTLAGYELVVRGAGKPCTFFIRAEGEDVRNYWMTELPLESGAITRVYIPYIENLATLEVFSELGQLNILELVALRVQSPQRNTLLTSPISLLIHPGVNVSAGFTPEGVVLTTATNRAAMCHISVRQAIAADDLVTIVVNSATQAKILNSAGFYDVISGEVVFVKFGATFLPPMLTVETIGGISNVSTVRVGIAVGSYFQSNIERHLRGNPNRPAKSN